MGAVCRRSRRRPRPSQRTPGRVVVQSLGVLGRGVLGSRDRRGAPARSQRRDRVARAPSAARRALGRCACGRRAASRATDPFANTERNRRRHGRRCRALNGCRWQQPVGRSGRVRPRQVERQAARTNTSRAGRVIVGTQGCSCDGSSSRTLSLAGPGDG